MPRCGILHEFQTQGLCQGHRDVIPQLNPQIKQATALWGVKIMFTQALRLIIPHSTAPENTCIVPQES